MLNQLYVQTCLLCVLFIVQLHLCVDILTLVRPGTCPAARGINDRVWLYDVIKVGKHSTHSPQCLPLQEYALIETHIPLFIRCWTVMTF